MAEPPSQGELFEAPAGSDVVPINARCYLRTANDHRVVSVAGVPVAHYAVGCRMAEAQAMVNLVEQGWADQNDIARAFGCSSRTVRRCQRRFEDGGLAALGRRPGYPKGRSRLRASRLRLVRELRAGGASQGQLAARLGVTKKAVRKMLRRLGFSTAAAEQASLSIATPAGDPNLSAFPAASADGEFSVSADANPLDRSGDRLLAYLGLINAAAPLFASGLRLPCAGVLLALPAIVSSGVLDCARAVYGCIGPAFYGLRTTVVALLLMALLRSRRSENLEERPPVDLGRVLGLDRAPEIKTLRRKLSRLAAVGRATEFGRAVARRRVAAHGNAFGFLYVEGHVRVYYGQRRIPKTHVARIRLAMPATSDYWVNDERGEPLFLVTAETNAGLCKMLPTILAEIRALIGERRTTVVFDRGGWSPALFAQLIGSGFDILTYRKGRCREVARRCFVEHSDVIDGRKGHYLLADQGIRLLGGRLRLRQVTRLSDGHQTPIVTSRRDLPAIEVAYRMFERWRQENFFKYMRDQFALDALVDYGVEQDDQAREVPNPRWAALDTGLRNAKVELQRVTARYGLAVVANDEKERRTVRGFKIANATAGRLVTEALKRCVDLENRRAKVPRRIPLGQAQNGEVVELAAEAKHLTSVLKMVAYQAETELVRVLVPHYHRSDDEGRTLVQTALASAADLEVTTTEQRVRLAPLSSAHRTRAVAALCAELDRSAVCFSGTKLRVRYAVAEPL